MTSTPPRILIIEDDAGFTKILSVLNRRWQLPLTILSRHDDIERALEAPESFAVIVSDCHVPRLDLHERLGALRAAHPEIDLVLMSNLDAEDLRRAGAGLAPALVEPKEHIIREPDAFAGRLRSLLERHAG